MRLLNWKRSRKNKYKQLIRIGIIGSAYGIGTTHLAIMLGNYYANGCGCRTIVIGYGSTDYMKICDEAGIKVTDIRHFTYKNIIFQCCKSRKEVADSLAEDYTVAIIDMGCSGGESLEEFKRCDVRIVMASTALWKIAGLKRLAEKLKGVEYSVAVTAPDNRSIRRLSQLRLLNPETVCLEEKRFFSVPIEPDPFYISSKSMYLLKEYMDTVGLFL